MIGGGAREHALVARLLEDPDPARLLCARLGIPELPRSREPSRPTSRARTISPGSRSAERIDFTIVGPEVPLSAGVADRFASEGRLLFGPTRAAAELESSKAFAKAFMTRHRVPTARFRTCDNASRSDGRHSWPGIRVSGRPEGRRAGGGKRCRDCRRSLMKPTRQSMPAMTEQRFGAAGSRLVIEEHLVGPEVSFFVVSDGTRAIPIGTAQDHKRIFDNDRGPNTGGMGAFAPSPLIDETLTPACDGRRLSSR